MARSTILVLAAATTFCGTTSAAVITYSYTGSVSGIASAGAPFGMVEAVGNPVSGSFVYDTTTPDQSPSPTFGHYAGGPGLFTQNFLSAAISDATWDLLVTLNTVTPTFHELEVFASTGVMVNGVLQPSADMYLQFRDYTSTAFADDSPPPSTLTMNNFTFGLGYIRDVTTGQRVDFVIGTLAGVPAPGSLTILGAGLGVMRRRRR